MNDINTFCYLVVKRQEANAKRRRLLGKLRRKRNSLDKTRTHGSHWTHRHRKNELCKDELTAYRSHADKMREIAKTVYSPMRRELKLQVEYDGNNMCKAIIGDGVRYEYRRVKQMADAYHFDTIVLDKQSVDNPYEGLA